jgi:hypothetical protein
MSLYAGLLDVGVKPVVVAGARVEPAEGDVESRTPVVDLALHVRRGAAERRKHSAAHRQALRPSLPRRRDPDDALGTGLLDRVEHGVGDLGERLVPRDALPLTLATFADAVHRVEQAFAPREKLAPRAPLLAAHRVHVRHALLDDRERAGLLLADDGAVLHIDAVRAVARVAVDRMAAPTPTVERQRVSVRLLSRLRLSHHLALRSCHLWTILPVAERTVPQHVRQRPGGARAERRSTPGRLVVRSTARPHACSDVANSRARAKRHSHSLP